MDAGTIRAQNFRLRRSVTFHLSIEVLTFMGARLAGSNCWYS